MELSEAVRILAEYADALPHNPPPISGGAEPEPVAIGFLSPEDALNLKKATVMAAGALKSINDYFGMPADPVMKTIRDAIAHIGELVETPGVFERVADAQQNGQAEVIALPAAPEPPDAAA